MPSKRSTTDLEQTVTVPWRDRTFTVPAQTAWTVETWEALEDGRFVALMRALLGPEQWAEFKASNPPPVLADMSALTDAIATASGFSGGAPE